MMYFGIVKEKKKRKIFFKGTDEVSFVSTSALLFKS